MSSGRSDYWYGMLPGQSALGVNQSGWWTYGGGNIASGGYVDIIEYTVPANYRLYLSGGVFSCTTPSQGYFVMAVDGEIIMFAYFSQIFTLPPNPMGGYVLEVGEVLTVSFGNADSITAAYRASLVGYEEYKID